MLPRGRRRSFLLASLALAIPLPALALSSGEPGAPPAPLPLSVTTSLDSCGVADAQVICRLNVSFNAIPGATSYAASVTRADGSVVDYGEVGAGGGSLWVPYTGSGTYSVRISAYGTPPEAERGDGNETGNELITSEATEATGVRPDRAGNALAQEDPGARAGDGKTAPNASATDAPGADADAQPPQSSCEPVSTPTPAPPDEEPMPEPPPTDDDPEDADEDDDGIDDADERAAYELALTKRTTTALEAEGELPDGIDCAEPGTP